MPFLKRLTPAMAAVALFAAVAAPVAGASTTQQFVIQDDGALHNNIGGTLATFRSLGATLVKVAVPWDTIAPSPKSSTMPKHFTASNPADYPAANWTFYDAVVRSANAMGMKVGFMITSPAPLWATGSGKPAHTIYGAVWKPSAADFGSFVKALATRYSGTYRPTAPAARLPRVSWWSIWNEPNYGPDLAPQAIDNNTVYEGAIQYRSLLSHAWGALASAGHTTKKDTILIGETAPRGVAGKGYPGNFSGTVPVTFLQALYCVSSSDRELTGNTAKLNDCPGTASRFRSQNPALFTASGYADHPYAQGTPPNLPTYACKVGGGNAFCSNARTKQSSPGYLDFAELGRLETLMQKLTGKSWPIWNTEFGYWTNPPDNQNTALERHEASTPATAAYYMNWAEYLSYENANVASYSQYLLADQVGSAFSTGLELHSGAKLATYAAYETPLYLPTTSASRATSLTVWGDIRPVATVLTASSLRPQAKIEFQAGSRGSWATLKTVSITNARGYFDVKVPFTRSGNVRIAWKSGTTTTYSRTQAITIK